jgi:hypothetical protein
MWWIAVPLSLLTPQADDSDGLEATVRARFVWAYAWGTASARNSFTRFERGEDLDLRRDFGLVNGGPVLDAELSVRFEGSHRVTLHSLFGVLSDRTVLDRTFEYNDNVFQAGEHARAELDFDFRDVEYAYRFLHSPTLTLWAGVGGRWADLNVGLPSSTLDPEGSMESNKALYPTLNASLQHRWTGSLALDLDVRGSPAAVPVVFAHASLGRFVEARAAVGWRIVDSVLLDAGANFLWVWQRWRGHESDGHFAVNYVDIRLFGPSVGLRISF